MGFFPSLISPWTQASYTQNILVGLLQRSTTWCLSWICCQLSPFAVPHLWSTFLPPSGPAPVLLCPAQTREWDVGRSRVIISCSMGGGDSGGSRVNHCRFGAAFIRRHLLSSANMIDYTTQLMIMVSTVMDALLTAVPQGRSCPCFWHNKRLLSHVFTGFLTFPFWQFLSDRSTGWGWQSEKHLICPAKLPALISGVKHPKEATDENWQ